MTTQAIQHEDWCDSAHDLSVTSCREFLCNSLQILCAKRGTDYETHALKRVRYKGHICLGEFKRTPIGAMGTVQSTSRFRKGDLNEIVMVMWDDSPLDQICTWYELEVIKE